MFDRDEQRRSIELAKYSYIYLYGNVTSLYVIGMMTSHVNGNEFVGNIDSWILHEVLNLLVQKKYQF